jgi:alcohol dehydrogenase (cytochrome c)
MPQSYDPVTGLLFVSANETCSTYFAWKPDYKAGELFWGGAAGRPAADRGTGYGALRAIDPKTGERRWEFRHQTASQAGVMSTASGLVFTGDSQGNVMAFDAGTGKNLWRYQTGSSLAGLAAVTYILDGRQFILVPSGATLTAFALPDAAQR